MPAPRKRFGQHFLVSREFIDRIVSAVAAHAQDSLVEIGPGHGALTDPLSRIGAPLHAIEFDRDLIAELQKRYANDAHVTIHEADALQFDYSSLGTGLRIVGNLPYNISTPLLFHLLEFRSSIQDAHFMLQKEVVERMSAAPGNKQYGRLTIMLGCRMQVVPLFDVPATAFAPPPRVVSSVVRLRPIPDDAVKIRDVGTLDRVVKTAFSQRRKTLRNALSDVATEDDFTALSLSSSDRPEQVPIADWIALANRLDEGDKHAE